MRLIAAAAIIVTSMLAVTGVGAACSNKTKPIAVFMGIAPEQTGHFAYWAIADLNEDEDLWDIYDRFKDSSDAQQLGELVQVLAIVKDSARIFGSDNAATLQAPVTALRADFDTKYVEGSVYGLQATVNPTDRWPCCPAPYSSATPQNSKRASTR